MELDKFMRFYEYYWYNIDKRLLQIIVLSDLRDVVI